MSIQEKLLRYSVILIAHSGSITGNHFIIGLTKNEYNELIASDGWSIIRKDNQTIELGGNIFHIKISSEPDILSATFDKIDEKVKKLDAML